MEIVDKKIGWSRNEMARNVALDIPDGSYVNLGIGIPELVADHVPEGREVIYHTENGLLGMGPVFGKQIFLYCTMNSPLG